MGVSTGAIIDFKSYYVGRIYVLSSCNDHLNLSDNRTVSGSDVLLADETLLAAGVMLLPWHWEVEGSWTRFAHAFLIDCTCECFIMEWASYSSL
jgi:hypothetical protein